MSNKFGILTDAELKFVKHFEKRIRKAERKRIIALLDGWRCGHPDCDADRTEVCYPKHHLIARIKGKF